MTDRDAGAGPTTLADGRAEVTVGKASTRNGERLRIEDARDGTTIMVDALGLESLSWQDPGELASLLGVDRDRARPPEGTGEVRSRFRVVNEFARVEVTARRVDGRDVLDVDAPKVDHAVRLTPAVLAAIAGREMDLFSTFLETPYGP